MSSSMHPPQRSAYGKVATIYDAVLAMTGFKRGVERFLDRLDLRFPPEARLLDAGCGTGLIACYLARRFPGSEIVAFDIDPQMLRAMEREIERLGIERGRMTIAAGDLREPSRIQMLAAAEPLDLWEDSFDGVFVSGALEHAPLRESLPKLVKLLKPGGVFLNLGVKKNPAGAVLGMVYRFRPYTIAELHQTCEVAGLEDIRVLRLKAEDFPANLSRIAIVAKKLETRK